MLVAVMATSATAGEEKPRYWGELTNNVQMSIIHYSLLDHAERNGPARLIIRIRNASSKDNVHFFRGGDTSSSDGVALVVTSPSGKDLSPSREPLGGSGAIYVIAPGQTNQFEFGLGQVCNLSETGTYKIVAIKTIYLGSSNQFEVVSNPLYLKVAP